MFLRSWCDRAFVETAARDGRARGASTAPKLMRDSGGDGTELAQEDRWPGSLPVWRIIMAEERPQKRDKEEKGRSEGAKKQPQSPRKADQSKQGAAKDPRREQGNDR
jgi:hypothetical protein